MKKPALLVLGLLLLAYISVYFIVPQYIIAKSIVTVNAAEANTAKYITDKTAWLKWWPGEHKTADTLFTFKGTTYTLKQGDNPSAEVQITNGDLIAGSQISCAAVNKNATTITWEAKMQSSLNPVTRINEFLKMKNQQQQMDTLLSDFRQFCAKEQ